jgi:hypothetical protein
MCLMMRTLEGLLHQQLLKSNLYRQKSAHYRLFLGLLRQYRLKLLEEGLSMRRLDLS